MQCLSSVCLAQGTILGWGTIQPTLHHINVKVTSTSVLSRIIFSCFTCAKVSLFLPPLPCWPSQWPQLPTLLLVFWTVAEIFEPICLWSAEAGCKLAGFPPARGWECCLQAFCLCSWENWTGMAISHLLPFLTGGDFLYLQIPFPSHTFSQLPSLPWGQGAPSPAG